MTRSTFPRALSKAVTVSRSPEGTSCTTSGEIFVVLRASRMTVTKIWLLEAALEEPRNSAALPDINKIAAASIVTFGRAS